MLRDGVGQFHGSPEEETGLRRDSPGAKKWKGGNECETITLGNNDERPEANLNIGERGPGTSKRQGKNLHFVKKIAI